MPRWPVLRSKYQHSQSVSSEVIEKTELPLNSEAAVYMITWHSIMCGCKQWFVSSVHLWSNCSRWILIPLWPQMFLFKLNTSQFTYFWLWLSSIITTLMSESLKTGTPKVCTDYQSNNNYTFLSQGMFKFDIRSISTTVVSLYYQLWCLNCSPTSSCFRFSCQLKQTHSVTLKYSSLTDTLRRTEKAQRAVFYIRYNRL